MAQRHGGEPIAIRWLKRHIIDNVPVERRIEIVGEPDLRAPALGRLDAAKADGAVLGALACGQSIEVELAGLGSRPLARRLELLTSEFRT